MSDDGSWPEEAVDFVQAIADTKLMLSHWYAYQGFTGPDISDQIALFSTTQDEWGHVRQLFLLLEAQGLDEAYLNGDREPEDVFNAATTDEMADDWLEFVVKLGLTDRAAYLLLDAIDHEDFAGLTDKIGEEEYSHQDFFDGWLEHLAETEPVEFEAALEEHLTDVLAFIGPAAYDDATDPLVAAGFTDRSAAELRAAFLEVLDERVAGTDATVPDVAAFDLAAWDQRRRRVTEGTIDADVLRDISGTENEMFAAE